ncbi:hypothetical protein [Enterococcus sp.]|uniref:hypothetical protein n=1 Tax=Enterococcus sp. TaxID=35783 RepID=UPI00289C312D|nr:hypothetical protein [Enterococcus sp.]
MKNLKKKTCKYPKCTKELPSEKSLFCMEHSRSLKEKRNLVGTALGSVAILGVTTLANTVVKKKL